MVEQPAVNRRVTGSSPVSGAIFRPGAGLLSRSSRLRRLSAHPVVLAWFALGSLAGAAEGRLELQLRPAKPEVFERVEIDVSGMPSAENVFDPARIALDLDVTPPSGRVLRVPGFFARDYERKLEQGREVLTARGEGGWHFRWLPLEPGTHKTAR